MSAITRRDQAPTGRARSTVVGITPSGPVLSGRRAPTRLSRAGTFVHVLDVRQRLLVALLTAGWFVAFVAFWAWWLQPDHRVGWVGLVVNTVLLFYVAYLPCYLLVAVNRIRQVDTRLPVPDLRVAFVVTKAPSEPWETARATLAAMLDQDYPHRYDVWLCDEDPTEATQDWCESRGIRVLSRRGVAEYHQPVWPRRTKCKEGNLAYFYDTVGYRDYDVVSQLDCDHVPARGYLAEMVRPFGDPAIGYVAAPSVCDSNASRSWSARGRLYKEATFHGAYQSGLSAGLAPISIGSHYAVRADALQDIGGVGPELAEDFSTSFLLTSAGWQGAFAAGAEAHGDGPLTFSSMVTQEFQWSRSLVVLLATTVPRHLPRLALKLQFRFLFALWFYPLLAVTTILGLALPPIAAVTGVAWVNVNYLEFLLRWALIGVCLVGMAFTLRHWGLLRPHRAPVISWENWLYIFARWPFIASGVLAALVQVLRPGAVVTFRVTPKAGNGMETLGVRLVLPFFAITMTLSIAALIGESSPGPRVGYVFLCLLGALCYAIVTLAVPVLHVREAARSTGSSFGVAARRTAPGPLALGLVAVVSFGFAVAPFPIYIAPLLAHGPAVF